MTEDSELIKLLDQCVKLKFIGFNELDNFNITLDIFRCTLERIYGMLQNQSKNNMQYVMNTYPKLGLCLTHLQSHPVVISNKYVFELAMKCTLWFYQTDGSTNIQLKANHWVRKQIQKTVSRSPDDSQVQNILLKKIENMSENEEMMREFWVKNYKLINLIEDRNVRNQINENLLRVMMKSPHENTSKKITKNIWENALKSDLSEEMRQTLWLLHSPGLESDVISLLECPDVDADIQLFHSCQLNPELFNRVLCILFAIFKATNYHPKPLKLASSLQKSIVKKSNDAQFCSQLHPLTWLLLTNPSDSLNAKSVFNIISELISGKKSSKDEVAFLLSMHSNWLRFLLRCINFKSEVDVSSVCSHLIHSPNCCQRLLASLRHPSHPNLVSKCPKCIVLSYSLFSSVYKNNEQVCSCLREIVSFNNLDVLLEWWQQE